MDLTKLSTLSTSKFKKALIALDRDYLTKAYEYCSNEYHNKGTSPLDDSKYDILVEYLNLSGFKEPVGYTPHGEKVKLPYWLGSLDKIKNTDENKLILWKQKNISKNYIIEEKLDGVSCLLIYTIKDGYRLYTRGDGVYGTDITHIKKYIKGIPKLEFNFLALRGELVMSKDDFNIKYSKKFKNSRNMITGLIGTKTLSEENKLALSNVQFVCYEIISKDISKPSEQHKFLKTFSFNTPEMRVICNLTIESLSEEMTYMKVNSKFDIDGITIQSDEPYIRNTDGNPKYKVAFKMLFEDMVHETVVTDVEWNVSRWGYYKPKIKFEPVETDGAVLQYTTGFNGKFIYENRINTGTKLKIARSGGVIPYIVEVVEKSAIAKMPIGYKWNDSKVDILCTSETDEQMEVKKLTTFFSKIGVKNVSEKTFEKIYNAGYTTPIDVLNMKKEHLMKLDRMGDKLAEKVYNSIHSIKEVPISKLLDASSVFGFGIGEKKLELIFSKYPDIINTYRGMNKADLIQKIAELEGFSHTTAERIVSKLQNADVFLKKLEKYITISQFKIEIESNELSGMVVCFTGFRDSKLKDTIQKNGGKVSDTVSKNTKVLIISSLLEKSRKVDTANKLDIPIMLKDEFIDKYIL